MSTTSFGGVMGGSADEEGEVEISVMKGDDTLLGDIGLSVLGGEVVLSPTRHFSMYRMQCFRFFSSIQLVSTRSPTSFTVTPAAASSCQ